MSAAAPPSPTPAAGAELEPAPPSRALPTSAWQKCIRYAEYARKNSPRVAALMRKIESRGCALATDPIICEDVFGAAPLMGGYDAVRRVVVMNPAVPDRTMDQSEWTRTITHELVHAFDACRAVVEPGNCAHVACTEVRAANLSGDCDVTVELARGGLRGWTLRGHQQKCVRRRAELSLSMHPECAAAGVRAQVDDVWEPCYRDTAPFATN